MNFSSFNLSNLISGNILRVCPPLQEAFENGPVGLSVLVVTTGYNICKKISY